MLTAIRPIDGKGRGVVAIMPIPEGATIETCHVKPFKATEKMPCPELPPEIADLPYSWTPGHCCLAMGQASFINHSTEPNVDSEWDYSALTITIVAMRDIEPGEELTIDYGLEPWWNA